MTVNWFAVMGASLAVLAGCALVTVLKAFGFWRWAKYQWADAKAWMLDAEEDDAPWIEIPLTFEPTVACQGCDGRGGSCAGCKGEGTRPRPADAPKKRKRRPKK